MSSIVLSAAVVGIDAAIVEVEADVSSGLPATVIVGLPDTAVQESRERVKAAVKNSGAKYPIARVSVNLAPADLPKLGTHYDLPVALSVLLAAGELAFNPAGKLFVGELSLDGRVRPVPGVLAVSLAAKAAGFSEVFVPAENAAEASLVPGVSVYAVPSFADLVAHLSGLSLLSPVVPASAEQQLQNAAPSVDFAEVSGQEQAKRALEIAAAGGHNVLMVGPPGSGKTLLARALSGILPNLSPSEALELTKIYSISGNLSGGMVTQRPVRSPHHSTSAVALVGGGSHPKPGEITLAHRGVLFLDEFPEFPRGVLESLRQPLEDGVVTVSRASGTVVFPAKFVLAAAQNPCPCGYYGDMEKPCTCTPTQVLKYHKKISGPLLDRIDLHVSVPRLKFAELSGHVPGVATSAEVKDRVESARATAAARLGGHRVNGEMQLRDVRKHCKLGPEAESLLEKATTKYGFSGRSYHRILKVARTIADLAGSEHIEPNHLAEAIQYRPKAE